MEHAIYQAKRRYGVDFTEDDVRQIANIIKRGGSLKSFPRDNTRIGKHIVIFRGRKFFVAYDKNRHTVASFLPMNSWEIAAARTQAQEPKK